MLTSVLLIAASVLGTSSQTSPLRQADLAIHDFWARHGRTAPANPKLIFLAIDTDSVNLDAEEDLKKLFKISDGASPEARALEIMSHQWPWSRDIYALILDRLIGAGARVVTFDLNFPTSSPNDTAFREALERHRGKVVIGSNFVAGGGVDAGTDLTLATPTVSLIPNSHDPRIGFVNFWPDADGVIRRAQFGANFTQLLPTGGNLGENDYASLAAQTLHQAGLSGLVPAGLGTHQFRFTAGPGEGFPPRSIFEIFVPSYWKRNFASGKVFEDAIVVVGSAGNWQHDDHQTPFGFMAGAEIQLNVINALLHGSFLQPITGVPWLLIQIAAGIITAFIALRLRSPWIRLGTIVGIGAGWVLLQGPLYHSPGLLLPIAGPLLIVVGIGFCALLYDLALSLAEELRLRLTVEERQRSQAALEVVNAGLEKRVEERTTELTSANLQLSSALDEKNLLLKEVHHRVKNNLQVISSLLNLQSGYISDPTALQVFTESRNRVRSMALIHEKLYQSQDLARIDFEDYIRSVSSGLQASFSGRSGGVRIAVDVDHIMLPVDSAVPCGLIVNELVTNSFKYAFTPRGEGEIRISMKRLNETHLRLSVSDDGVGFPQEVDFRNTESLGMQLVTTLSEQLDGTVSLKNGTGTTFEISFPENNSTKL